MFAGAIFDWAFYDDTHRDVVNAVMDLTWHWRNHGFNEGRQGSPEFHSAYYLEKHPDLRNWLGPNNYSGALAHWLDQGIGEGRQASRQFSMSTYLARSPDLQQAFGKDYNKALDHWMEWGQYENRSGTP